MLTPAALEDAITADNAGNLKADIIVEGANAPTTPEADEMLTKRGVLIVPDILANTGGVAGRYFESAQNIQQFRLDVKRVNEELSKVIRKAYQAVRQVSKDRNLDMRTAAFVLAIQRVGQAALARTQLNTKLPFE